MGLLSEARKPMTYTFDIDVATVLDANVIGRTIVYLRRYMDEEQE